MAYIDLTRRNFNTAHQNTVCLTKNECSLLLPFFEKAEKSIRIKFEKYKDIHESGEATDRQQTLMVEYSDQLNSLLSAIDCINELLERSTQIR